MINNLAIQQLNVQKQSQQQLPNGTANELIQNQQQQQQLQQDQQQQEQPQFVPYSNAPIRLGMSKTSKMILIAMIIVGFLVIVGLLIGILYANASQLDDYNAMIKTPPQYKNFEKIINQGQKDNLVKMRNVPRAAINYKYVSINNQTTFQRNENNGYIAKSVITKIIHKISLLTVNVTEANFEMFLIFQNSTIQENDKVVGQFKGFSEIVEEETKTSQKRRLQSQKQDSDSGSQNENKTEEEVNSFNLVNMKNEYSPLKLPEIEILKQFGITKEEFEYSNYPLIKFIIAKDGTIEKILLPINIRYDIFQIYLNVLEQLIPRLSADIYNIIKEKEGKTRVLKQRSRVLQERNLAGELVIPTKEAHLEGNRVSLSSKYNTEKQFENLAEILNSYNQKQFVESAGLVQSQVNSQFKIQNGNEGSDNDLFDKIKLDSEIQISFEGQNFDVGDQFLEKLEKCVKRMSILVLNWDQALDMYDKANNDLKEIEGEQQSKRLLQQEIKNQIADVVTKELVSYNLGPIALVSQLTTYCQQDETTAQENLCKVIIGLKVGKQEINVFQKDANFNVYKLIKYYEAVVSLLDNKIASLTDIMKTKLTGIKNAIEAIINKIFDFLEVKKNPIFKELDTIINDDALGIGAVVKTVEDTIISATQSYNEIKAFVNSLINLKQRIEDFVYGNKSKVLAYFKDLKEFGEKKYAELQKFIENIKNIGLNQQQIDLIKTTVNNYEIQVKDQIEKAYPEIKKQLETYLQEKLKEVDYAALLGKIDDKAVNSEIGQKIKEYLVSQGVKEMINKAISDAISNFLNKRAILDALLNSVTVAKNQLIAKIDAYKIQPGAPNINDLTAVLKSISDYVAANPLSKALDFKELNDIFEETKRVIGKDVRDNLIKTVGNLIQLPNNFYTKIVEKIQEVGNKVTQKGQDILKNIELWRGDIKNAASIVFVEVQTLFKDLRDIVKTAKIDESNLPQSNNSFKADFENIYSKVSQCIDASKNAKLDFKEILNQVSRISQIPAKFKEFMDELKNYQLKAYDKFLSAKSSLLSASKEGIELYDYIVSQLKVLREKAPLEQLTKKRILQVSLENISVQFNGLVDTLQGFSQFSTLILPYIQLDKEQLKQEIIQKVIELSKFINYKKKFESTPLTIDQTINFYIPTAIGISVKIGLGITASTKIDLEVGIQQGIVQITCSPNLKISLKGSVAADLYVVSVGGFAQGVVIDGNLDLVLKLQIFERFKGNVEVFLAMNPFKIKLGIYMESQFNIEGLKCFVSNNIIKDQQGTRRQLGVIQQIKGKVKLLYDETLKVWFEPKQLVEVVETWFKGLQEKAKEYIKKVDWDSFADAAKCLVENYTQSKQIDLITPFEKTFASQSRQSLGLVEW